MPSFNDLITRAKADPLFSEVVLNEIIEPLPEQSIVMQVASRLPNMTNAQTRMRVLSSLPQANFVTGDTGLKPTADMQWRDVYVNAEELAVIVPIPENVLDDADYDIWGQVQPRIVEAFGRAFDAAVLFGTNAPASWQPSLLAGATAASHTVAVGANADLYQDILGASGVNSLIEADGFEVNGYVAGLGMRSRLRGLADSQGRPIFLENIRDGASYQLLGDPIFFPRNGSFDATQALMFAGDWSQLVFAMRSDVTFKVLDQAVIQDSAGNTVYNLAQQDMVALRAVMRLGWALPNPLNNINTNDSTRYPFAVLTP